MKSILGKKLGMTQIFQEDGTVVPVTVVQAGPVYVTQIKDLDRDGYQAIQVGYEIKKEKQTTQPLKGHFAKAGTSNLRYLREILTDSSDYELGQEIKVDIFAENDLVDVTGNSKGKGTQGVIKRYNYGRGPMSHGSKAHRVAGARSAGAYPGRVFPGTKGSGKMGNERTTVQNLMVVRVDAENNLLLIKGAIPGPKGGLVIVRQAKKANQ